MKIRLSQIADDPFLWQETLDIPLAELDRSELASITPVECRGKAARLESGFYLHADLAYTQILICDRCLGEYEEPVDESLDLLVQTGDDTGDVEEEKELEEKELGFLQLEGEVLDTEPLVREQVQLGIPMKPLCREDCKGLCSECGKDLNEGECECTDDEIDPRWAALAALKKPEKQGS